MHKTIKYQGFEFAYHVEGKGDPMVLIHGFCEDSNIWSKLTPELSKKHTLIIPEMPGYGKSPLPQRLMEMEDLAEIVNRCIEAEGVKECIMIGHSMGGYIALAFAEKYANKLLGLGMFHSHPFPDNDETARKRRKSMEFIKRHDTHQFISEFYTTLFSRQFRTKNWRAVEDLERYAYKFPARALVDSYQAMLKRDDRSVVLARAGYPVLFIIGKEDSTIPYQKSIEQTHLPPVSDIHILENCGHMGMLELPDEVIKIIKGFVSKQVMKKV